MKYKVIIADDEESIREGLKYVIDWSSYDFEITQTFPDGRSALEYIKANHVDLALVDINMPGITGLELIEAIRQFNTHTRLIIVSGYDDFKYAQQAINYDILTYLLKPIEEKELESAVMRAKKYYASEEHNYYLNSPAFVNAENNPLVKPMSVSSMCKNADRIYYISIIEDGAADISNDIFTLSFNQNIHNIISKHSAEILGKNNSHMFFKSGKNETSIILPVGQSFKYPSLNTFLRKLENLFSDLSVDGYFILIGQAAKNSEELCKSKNSIEHLKNMMIHTGLNSIMDYNSNEYSSSLSMGHFNIDTQVTEKIFGAIRRANSELLNKYLDEFCDIVVQKKITYKEASMYVHSIVMYSIEFIKSIGKASYMLDLLTSFNTIGYTSINNFRRMLAKFSYITIAAVSEENKKESLHIISDILDYINTNYSKNINLQTISKKFYINSAYLGRLFKQKTGMPFNIYLNKVRIDCAKELLKKTNLKLSDIAEKIGYNNFNYFIKKFKEYEKTTPKEYRENNGS